jgi:hypothetical protein
MIQRQQIPPSDNSSLRRFLHRTPPLRRQLRAPACANPSAAAAGMQHSSSSRKESQVIHASVRVCLCIYIYISIHTYTYIRNNRCHVQLALVIISSLTPYKDASSSSRKESPAPARRNPLHLRRQTSGPTVDLIMAAFSDAQMS